jgi:phosphoserine phosphatase
MSLKLLTLVASESFSEEDVNNFCKNNFNLFIKDSKALSNNAVQLTIDKSDNIQSTDIEQTLDSKKVDFCIQEKIDTQYKILLCDMDATMIANETLDDLVKLTGVKTNIDETSKLAMEGKIDLRTTLKNRVELLKGHPKSLIDEVKNEIRFNAGAETLIKTLNSHGLITNLVTGGFEPISTYVGEKLEFHNIISNQFVFDKNDCFTGEYHLINGEKNSKYKYMERLSQEKNVDFYEMVSVGDGSNDIEMLKNSGLGVGYYAHDVVRKSIVTQIKFTDLKTILFFLGIKENEFSK